jgi:hypothetical protein
MLCVRVRVARCGYARLSEPIVNAKPPTPLPPKGWVMGRSYGETIGEPR